MRKLTNKEFLEKLNSIHGDEYTPLQEYKTAKSEIKVLHNKCGKTFITTPDKLYNGGCIVCGYEKMKSKQRKTHDQFVLEVKEKGLSEYEVISTYENNTTKIKLKHLPCNHEYLVTPRDFLSGRRCPNCRFKRLSISKTKTHEYFLGRLGNLVEGEYELLSEYINGRTKISLKHKECGLIFESLPGHILEGKGCPNCANFKIGQKLRKTHEQFVSEIGTIWFNDNELLDLYETQTKKVRVRHKKCNRIFSVVPDSLLRGSGCPYCKESKGEKKISKFLIENNIPFIPQYKFDNCKFIDRLSYDFAILNNEKEISHLIEFQGIQHFEPVEFFGGDKTFGIQQFRDEIKRNFAEEMNITLIEIPYYIEVENALSKLIPR